MPVREKLGPQILQLCLSWHAARWIGGRITSADEETITCAFLPSSLIRRGWSKKCHHQQAIQR